MKDLRRAAYQRLLSWKQSPGHKTLEVSGARQVGKTYLVNKFADEQYAHKVYVNLLELSGEIFRAIYQSIRKEMKEGKRFQNPVKELLLRYEPDFIDSSDTVVVIDEIQEAAEIYNRIREFTRSLASDFIVTGSYLGFVYLDIKRRGGAAGELTFEMPAFATWGQGELDFYTKTVYSGKTYVIEVKAGKNSAKTAMEVLEKGKADYLLIAKGNTYGGRAGRIYTIPVYGISKFKF